MDEMEMNNTLYQVAKMKAEFQLLKSAIMNNLTLNYTGDELRLKDDRLIIEVMYLIEAEEMDNAFCFEKEKAEKAKDGLKEDDSNG